MLPRFHEWGFIARDRQAVSHFVPFHEGRDGGQVGDRRENEVDLRAHA